MILSPSSLENFLKPLEDFMGISNHARPGRMSSAHAISTIVGHKKVDLPLVVLGGNEIVIAGNLTIAVEIEDSWRTFIDPMEPTADGYAFFNLHKMDLRIGSRGTSWGIPPWVEHDLEHMRLVENRKITLILVHDNAPPNWIVLHP